MTTVTVSRPAVTRAAAGTFVATAIGVAVSFATSVAIARTLGASSKGIFDLAVATASLLALVLGFALPTGITYTVARGVAAPRRVTLFVTVLAVAQAAGAWVILGLADHLPPIAAVLGTGIDASARFLVAGLVGATALGANLRAVASGRLRVALAAWIDLGGRVLILIGIVALAMATRLTPTQVVGVFILGTLAAAIALGGAGVRGAAAGSGLGLGSGLRLAIPSYVANVLQFLNYRLDLFFVAAFLTSADVGIYALAATLGQMVWLVSNSVAAALFPSVAAADASDPEAGTRTSAFARFALASGILFALALGVVSIPTVGPVFGPEFERSVPALWLLLPGIAAFAPVNVLAAHLAGLGRADLNLVVSGVSLVVTIALDIALIPSMGVAGAAVATTSSYLAAAIAIILLYRRVTGQPARTILVVLPADIRLIAAGVASLFHRAPSGSAQ